ncbi:POC1 centriolar protein A [Tritrichomonas musculus]|uniref:POC1 centriolar protein A n=1 Tax=Tritrichomonas musculus TaxID=1915356 RepID=A0ABR2JXI1_9EUKA
MDPQLLRSYKIKQGSVRCICILDDNSFAAAGTSLGTVLLFPLDQNLRPKQLTGHQDVITCIEPLPETSFYLTGSKDGTVRIWRDQDSTIIRPNDGPIKTISISANSSLTSTGSVVFIVGKNGSPSIWSIDRCEQIMRLPDHDQITCGVISDDGSICLTGSADGVCRFFDTNTGKMVRSFKAAASIDCVALSENGPFAVAGCSDGEVSLFNFRQNEFESEAQIHNGRVTSIQFHPIMNLIITGSEDSTIKIINSSSLKVKYTLEGHSSQVRYVRWSDDGEKLVSCADDQGILILSSPGDDLSDDSKEEEEDNIDDDEDSLTYHNSTSKTRSTITYSDSFVEEEEIVEQPLTEEQIKIEKMKMILAQILEIKKSLLQTNERILIIEQKITLIEKAQDEENLIIKSKRK